MRRQVDELIKTLTDHYSPDEEIFVIWVSKEEASEVIDREVTHVEWASILTELEKRECASESLDADFAEAIGEVIKKG